MHCANSETHLRIQKYIISSCVSHCESLSLLLRFLLAEQRGRCGSRHHIEMQLLPEGPSLSGRASPTPPPRLLLDWETPIKPDTLYHTLSAFYQIYSAECKISSLIYCSVIADIRAFQN